MKKHILLLAMTVLTFRGLAQSGLDEGITAPTFHAKDNNGRTIDLKQLLKAHKAVVLFFYRGQWCPYCNKYISQMQDSLQLLTAKGAYVIGVTPETGENINKTIEKTHASFSIIQDEGYKIMKAYKVNYKVDDEMLSKLSGYGIDLEMNNGNKDHMLPVPATYIIDGTGKIIFVHFDKDYTHRPSIRSLLGKI
jgi:peroxiredoxin